MRAKIFNLTYEPSLGGFDDSALQTLLRDEELTSFQAQFFDSQAHPSLCCVVVWRTRDDAEPPGATSSAAIERSAPRERTRARERVELDLSASERRVFEALRSWRRTRASELAVPAYRVLTDRQLASVARMRPLDEPALAALASIGVTRAQRCGDTLFGALRAATTET